MNINHLPDDCLRLIFQRVPLGQQIRLRLVCQQWKLLIEQMFADSMHSLKLFAYKNVISLYIRIFDNHLMSDHIDYRLKEGKDILVMNHSSDCDVVSVCGQIPKVFPNVYRLMVSSQLMTESEHFPVMLQQWPNLISLSLLLENSTHLPASIWDSISSLQSLRRLSLFATYRNQIPDNFVALSRLEELHMVQYLGESVKVLIQLGPNCRFLTLSWIYLNADQLEQVLLLNPQLGESLKGLTIGFITNTVQNMSRVKNFYKLIQVICRRFKSLNFLNIMFGDHLPLAILIPELVKLPNLNKLWLYVSPDQLPATSVSTDTFPQLKTIQEVYMEIYHISLNDFELWFGRLFPNLQHLTVKCDFEEDLMRDKFRAQCFNLFKHLQSFKFKNTE